ncbi:hypothetical protein JCM6882_005233 [Rhodosporidiobolus microsporus]
MPVVIQRKLNLPGDRPHVLDSVTPADTVETIHSRARDALMDEHGTMKTLLTDGRVVFDRTDVPLGYYNINGNSAVLMLLPDPN